MAVDKRYAYVAQPVHVGSSFVSTSSQEVVREDFSVTAVMMWEHRNARSRRGTRYRPSKSPVSDCGPRESVLHLDSFWLITDVDKRQVLLRQPGSQGAQ